MYSVYPCVTFDEGMLIPSLSFIQNAILTQMLWISVCLQLMNERLCANVPIDLAQIIKYKMYFALNVCVFVE